MFDSVRKHKRILQFVLLLLVVPSFVLFGIEGYMRNQDRGAVVARVDGQDITQAEWDNAHRQEVDQLRRTMPSLDAQLLDSPQAKYASLERLVRSRVLQAAATSLQLSPSDQRVATTLTEDPAIAALRRPDGTLDVQRYRELVSLQGLSPEGFEARIRSDLAGRQVFAGVSNSSLAGQSVSDLAINAFSERREIQVARFDAVELGSKLNLSDADVKAFYDANPQLFQAPEQADIEYLVLDIESLKNSITLGEDDLKAYYKENAARLSGQEERRASHILINAPKTMSDAERQAAKTKAQDLQAQAKREPAKFAELAKKNSQDPGSAEGGGDLDFFARGAMTKPFEDTVFGMKKGDVSDVVETEFGYHVIFLADIKAPKQRSFEELKPEIEADLKKQQAQRKFTELADSFSNAVYESADGLKPVAERLKLNLNSATAVTRAARPGQAGVLANPKFLEKLFAPESIDNKRNTEAVETASNQLVSGRVVKHMPARTQGFEEVKDRARAQLVAQRGAQAAQKEGADKLAAWTAKPESASLGAAQVVSRTDSQAQLPPSITEAALRADPAKLPAFTGVDLGAQGYAVLRVNRVLPRDEAAAKANMKEDREQYARAWGAAETLAYYDILKTRYKAEIKVSKPAPRERDGGARVAQ
jgi:peptidyl-prolyl cis-trans isomerase D